MTIHIKNSTSKDRDWITEVLIDNWASSIIVTKGTSYQADLLPALIADLDGNPSGVLIYSIKNNELEIVSLNAIEKGKGIGSALLDEIEKIAKEQRCRRIWLITTNDNIDALRFYQRRGYEIAFVHRHAIQESRKIKPQLPFVGKYGIPIRDEIEMEKKLV